MESVKEPLAPGLVTPLKTMLTATLAAIVWPLDSEHSTAGSVSREQKPTAAPPTVTVPPAQLARLVPGGKLTLMRLLACSDSAPVDEVVKPAR